MKKYDSRKDTKKHIARVQELLGMVAEEFVARGMVHDETKLGPDEKPFFDEFTPKLKDSTYGSDEYKQFLVDLKPALDNHYTNNSHHPEHYENGVNDMNLFDIVEMFFDWRASSERHATGNINDSVNINQKRFEISDQLAGILRNTIEYMKWEK